MRANVCAVVVAVLLVITAIWFDIPDARAANPDAHLALDMMVRERSQSCETLAGRYLTCDSIRTALPDTGDFRAAVVLYYIESARGVEYALSWPEGWEIESFTACGTLTVGGEISSNPMNVSTVWSTPQTASGSQGVMVGLLTGHATSPGCITITTPDPGGLLVVDSLFQSDSILTVVDGCVAAESSGDPCELGELVAGFGGSVTSGMAPLEVAFIDRSRGGATAWLWDFGDGDSSASRNPQHIYTEPGAFTVRLRVEREDESDESVRTAYVTVSQTALPGEAVATDTYFTWKPTGLERVYEPKGDEVIVEFKGIEDSTAIIAIADEYDLTVNAAGVLAHTWAVYQLPGSDGATALAGELQLDTVMVANVLPVMQLESGIPSYFLPGALAVRFGSGVAEAERDSILSGAGSTILERYRIPGLYCVSKPPAASLFGVIRMFSDLPEIESAEPLHFSPERLIQGYHPEDLGLPLQWALYNDGTYGTAGADIKAYHPHPDSVGAWDFTVGDRSVVIADLDVSYDLNHPDLVGNILEREHRDWRFDGNDPSDCPDSLVAVTDSCRSPVYLDLRYTELHGTKTAGVAAATADGATDSSQAMVGVAPGCWLLPLGIPALGENPFADSTTYEPILMEAVNYAANYIVDTLQLRGVMSMSWGHCTIGDWEGLHGELDRAFEKGMVLVAARGNRQQSPSAPCFGGLIPTYPAAWSTVISVTSTDGDDLKASHAKWGSTVSVAAPGEDIYMTEPPAADSSASSWHIIDDGTSFATPHVAGLAPLILSKHGTLSPTNVRDIIEQTADRVHASTDSTSNYFYWEYGPPGNPDSVKCLALGYGRVNARAALEAATTDVAENAFQPLLSSGNTARRLMGSPIPFHLGEGVKLTFAAPGGRRLEVGIYDAAGRRVRSLPREAAAPGEQVVCWDGKDGRGRLVSPGVYFAVLSGGGTRASHKLVAVR